MLSHYPKCPAISWHAEGSGVLAGCSWHRGAGESWGLPTTPVCALQTLSLQRQMMENLVIAKAREETVSFPSYPCGARGLCLPPQAGAG